MFDEYRKYVKQLIDIVTYKNKGTRESSFLCFNKPVCG